MRLAIRRSKMANGSHKVKISAVLTFCWRFLHFEAEQLRTIFKDTKYCAERYFSRRHEAFRTSERSKMR